MHYTVLYSYTASAVLNKQRIIIIMLSAQRELMKVLYQST